MTYENRWKRPAAEARLWMRPAAEARLWLAPNQDRWRSPQGERLFGKAGYDPAQPRRPRGDPDGPGRWVDEDGSGEQPAASSPPGRPVVVIRPTPPGIGHNGGPPLDPLAVPGEPPATGRDRFSIIKDAVRWLNPLRSVRGFVGAALAALSAAAWAYPYISSYFDDPRTFADLVARAATPSRGYEQHHVVEQTAARNERYPRTLIDGQNNIVLVPTLRHWEITGWYSRRNPEFGNMTPREYLVGKSWEERVRVGRIALIKFGVLQP